jgi:hypothetical protein
MVAVVVAFLATLGATTYLSIPVSHEAEGIRGNAAPSTHWLVRASTELMHVDTLIDHLVPRVPMPRSARDVIAQARAAPSGR